MEEGGSDALGRIEALGDCPDDVTPDWTAVSKHAATSTTIAAAVATTRARATIVDFFTVR